MKEVSERGLTSTIRYLSTVFSLVRQRVEQLPRLSMPEMVSYYESAILNATLPSFHLHLRGLALRCTQLCPAQSDGERYRNKPASQCHQLDYTLDFKNNRTEYTFDGAGQLTEMIEGVGTTAARTTSYTWNDALNLPASVTVAGIRKIDYLYTATGRVDLITVTNLSTIGVPNQTQLTDYWAL